MNNQVHFLCVCVCVCVCVSCVSLDFAVQINNFFSLVLFSAAIHKSRGKKPISKTVKRKETIYQDKIYLYFIPKTLTFLLENYRFCWQSGNDANSRWHKCSLHHFDAIHTAIYMWFTPKMGSTDFSCYPKARTSSLVFLF